jgi:hypothetical protein
MKNGSVILIGTVVVLVAVSATLSGGSRRVGVLSDGELACLWGGDTWCVCSSAGLGSNCECKTSVNCEDIECSKCKAGAITVAPYQPSNGYWCMGEAGLTMAVTACYWSPTSSDKCKYTGTSSSTSCEAYTYDGSSCDDETELVGSNLTVWRKLCTTP